MVYFVTFPRCEDGEAGDLILHYYSGRPGLHPIVKGRSSNQALGGGHLEI